MKKNLYYIDGAYQEEDAYRKANAEKLQRIKKRKRFMLVITALCCIGCIALIVKYTVYTEQYFWTNDLMAAIEENDAEAVEEMLQNDQMDVNQPGGSSFPLYYLHDIFSRSYPLERALSHGGFTEDNTDIIALLLDHGAKCDINEAFRWIHHEYAPYMQETVNHLVQYAEETEQSLTDDTMLMVIAQWNPGKEAERRSLKEEEMEQKFADMFAAVYGILEKDETIDNVLEKMLSAAETSGNETLVQFIQREMGTGHE